MPIFVELCQQTIPLCPLFLFFQNVSIYKLFPMPKVLHLYSINVLPFLSQRPSEIDFWAYAMSQNRTWSWQQNKHPCPYGAYSPVYALAVVVSLNIIQQSLLTGLQNPSFPFVKFKHSKTVLPLSSCLFNWLDVCICFSFTFK